MLSCSVWFSAPSFWMDVRRCIGRVHGTDGAVRHARHHPYRTPELRSDSQDNHPSRNSVQKTVRCNSTSNAPGDVRMYPKHVELRIRQ